MNGEGTHFRYTQKQIDQMEDAAKKHFRKIEKAYEYYKSREVSPEVMLLKLRKDDWLHFALLNYTAEVVGKRVVVVGSVSPWVETLALALGAASVTTLEVSVLSLECFIFHSSIHASATALPAALCSCLCDCFYVCLCACLYGEEEDTPPSLG